MKNISNNLKELLNKDYIKLAKCFTITLQTGEIIGLTEHSQDLQINNTTYYSSNGFEHNNSDFTSNLSNSISEIIGLIDNNTININDIITGKFDNAKIEIFYIDTNDENFEKIHITTGNITSININDGKITFSINNILNVLDKTIGDIYSPLCRAQFCDQKCLLNINDYTFTSKITHVKSDTEFLYDISSIGVKDKNYFKYGIVIFTSGKNINQSMEIKQSFDNDIILNTKLNYSLTVGDTFKIIVGCDKTISSCINKFNNAINFRGEPHIANTTKVYKFY